MVWNTGLCLARWGQPPPPGCAPSWSPVKINPVLDKPRTLLFPNSRGAGSHAKFQTPATRLTWAQQSLPEEHQLLDPSSSADAGNQEAAEAVALTAPGCTILAVQACADKGVHTDGKSHLTGQSFFGFSLYPRDVNPLHASFTTITMLRDDSICPWKRWTKHKCSDVCGNWCSKSHGWSDK